jgi:hypothetical protein
MTRLRQLLPAIVALIVVVAAALTAVLTAVHNLAGAAQAAVFVASVVAVTTGALKFIDTVDKHLALTIAGDIDKAKAWANSELPQLTDLYHTLAPVVDVLPGVPAGVQALSDAVASLDAKVTSSTGIDLDAVVAAVRQRLAQGLTEPPAVAAPVNVIIPAPPNS